MLKNFRAKWYGFISNTNEPVNVNLTPAQWRRRHSRILVRQIQSSLKLQPIALIAQGMGASALAVAFWQELNHAYLIAWLLLVALHCYGSLEYSRRFWADRVRQARIQFWVRAWMVLAIVSGVIWAIAGVAFGYLTDDSITYQILLVSVILTVTFASWPIYACWLPSLGTFTLLSLSPLTLQMTLIFGWSRLVIAALLVGVIVFIFYCGRRFSDIVVMSVKNEQESEVLVNRLKLEKKLAEKMRREALEHSRTRAKFFQAANHDIRQPLQAIGIYIELLKTNPDPQTQQIVEQLAKTTGALQTLATQILEVSRLETGHMTVKPEPINVVSLFEELREDFSALASDKSLKFRVKAIDATIYTDRQLLVRALRNLLTNAIRYTQTGEVLLAARLLAGKRVSLCVLDSGPGIAPDEQKKIFEHFYRSDATREVADGYGLGLSIVKAVADQLNLELSLSSRLRRGSIFRLLLPVHEAEQAELFNKAQITATRIENIQARALLIEDNALVRESLAALMQTWGMEVSSFAAMPQVEIGAFDVIISDYNLGAEHMNGLEVMLAINRKAGKSTKAILLTAVASDKIELNYRRILATLNDKDAAIFALPKILQKPVTGELLNEAIRELL